MVMNETQWLVTEGPISEGRTIMQCSTQQIETDLQVRNEHWDPCCAEKRAVIY